MIPTVFADLHEYNTRGRQNVRLPGVNHEYAKKCLRYNITRLLDTTPDNILNKVFTHSKQGFNNYVKLSYINDYSDSCDIQNCYICNNA